MCFYVMIKICSYNVLPMICDSLKAQYYTILCSKKKFCLEVCNSPDIQWFFWYKKFSLESLSYGHKESHASLSLKGNFFESMQSITASTFFTGIYNSRKRRILGKAVSTTPPFNKISVATEKNPLFLGSSLIKI